jgi:pimeloyl-ACP methyl ester carboxylesterase
MPCDRLTRRAAGAAALLLLGTLAAGGRAAAASAAAAPGSRLALADCRLAHPAGLGSVPARCGTLAVPENPAEPRGRQIALAVAVVPALAARPGAPPLFVVAGGPGQAASDFYAAFAAAFDPIERSRDVVLLDQRGTGRSNRLACRFPDDFEVAAPSPALLRELSATCRRGLAGRPEYYTTSVAVRDLDAVRAALGYQRIDLYGASYGTRVVQHYVRRFPARAAAVVLDGAVPPDRALGPDTPLDAQRALDLTLERCRLDAACNGAFPDLAHRFATLLAELQDRPRSLTLPDPATGAPRRLDFDRAQLTGAVRLLNYYSATTALLPLFIDRASMGDYAPLASQLLLLGQNLDQQLAYGMNAAVACTEDVPAYARADRTRLARTYLGLQQLDELAVLCEGWPRGVVDADLFAPLDSAVPALILSGEVDPITPPAAGARAAGGFRDALHVVVAGQGHGQLAAGCAARVIASFLSAGTTRGLDVRCLAAAAASPFVIDLAGPSP